ncbi:hypothetical protein WAI453_006483 [Rhynchosporium graminicola]
MPPTDLFLFVVFEFDGGSISTVGSSYIYIGICTAIQVRTLRTTTGTPGTSNWLSTLFNSVPYSVPNCTTVLPVLPIFNTFAETLAAVDKLHKEGKFVRLGLSNFTAFEVAEVVLTCKFNNWVRPTIYQGIPRT